MKPEANAQNVLSTTRARAKMREFRVAEGYFNQLPRDPAILFGLAIGILGDVASIVSDQIGGEMAGAPGAFPMPTGWEDDAADPQVSLRFASMFFDAYINAELDAELTPELSLLCAAAYYIAGQRRQRRCNRPSHGSARCRYCWRTGTSSICYPWERVRCTRRPACPSGTIECTSRRIVEFLSV